MRLGKSNTIYFDSLYSHTERKKYMYHHSKIFNILLAILCLTMTAVAQNPIPNPGFENWTEGQPDGWLTYNSPFATFITQSSTRDRKSVV